jgi:hypothetical protein
MGIIFLSGHGSSLVAGYNTASEAERALYDIKAIQKFIGLLFLVLVVLFFVIVIVDRYGMDRLSILSFSMIIIVTLSGVAYLFMGKRFRRPGS